MESLERGIVGILQYPSVVPGQSIKIISITTIIITGLLGTLLISDLTSITNTEPPVTSTKRMVGVSNSKQ
jgi:hypothetical protein